MKNRRWRLGALAGAVALLGSLASIDAHALALGRITVQSAIGEPLRAEIDIADITAAEASSLRATVASSDAFKAAGLEYPAVIAGLEIRLQRRPDGRAYLQLSSSRQVSEPFIDLILEARWASGQLTRDYTLLFDPPGLRSSIATAPVAPTAPVLSRPSPIPMAPMALPPAPPPVAARAPVAPAYTPPAAVRPTPAAPVSSTSPASGQVTVKPGDTAGKIAATQARSANVSLDQMLVALLRSNPDAFIGGNVNRLKSGAVLDVPSTEAANAISSSEASRTIVAQSRDFNAFRRKLADNAPSTTAGSADRAASGKVQASVEDRSATSATPDKLTLSKGAVQGKAASAAEERIARERQTKEASSRAAELAKNINDLNKLSAAPGAAAPATTAPAANATRAPGVAVTTPSSVSVSAPTAATAPVAPATTASRASAAASAASATSAAATATAPVPTTNASAVPASTASPGAPAAATVAASAPTTEAAAPLAAASASSAAPIASPASAPATTPIPAPVAAKPPAPAPVPVAEPSFLDELLDNPFFLPGVGLLILLLAGAGIYRYRKRSNPAQVDSSFLESRLQPDSFFGASGGQRIDTNESNATGSSLVYSPSQLDAAGDVDPVAEADVYLAYGRDLQAEEILKEALRTSPMRVAIHAKLLEIYAKRRDVKAFEVIANDAFKLTNGNGPEWAYITELGRDLDADNALYQPGGHPSSSAPPVDHLKASPFDAVATIPSPHAVGPSAPVDFDLDLDFSAADAPATIPGVAHAELPPAPPPAPAPRPVAPPVSAPAPLGALDMDFGISTVALKPNPAKSPTPAPAPIGPAAAAVMSAPDIDFPSNDLEFTTEPLPTPTSASRAPAPPAVADSGMLEFDLGSLSLDLEPEAAPVAEDPLETKFQLAEEFRALGDSEGARSLAEEVLAKAHGPLKLKAQAFINALS